MSWMWDLDPRRRFGRIGVSGVTTSAPAVRRNANPDVPNRLWIADIAPISLSSSPLYLGTVFDCCTSGCLSWTFSEQLTPALVKKAVERATETLRPRTVLVARGLSRPVALGLTRRCAATGLGSTGDGGLESADQAVPARFFDWLEGDLLAGWEWDSVELAKLTIVDWIVSYYNPAVASQPVRVLPGVSEAKDS